MEEKKKPIFNKRIFWDVNFEQLDYEEKANFFIERFLSAGMWRISAIAGGIMEMKEYPCRCYKPNICHFIQFILRVQ